MPDFVTTRVPQCHTYWHGRVARDAAGTLRQEPLLLVQRRLLQPIHLPTQPPALLHAQPQLLLWSRHNELAECRVRTVLQQWRPPANSNPPGDCFVGDWLLKRTARRWRHLMGSQATQPLAVLSSTVCGPSDGGGACSKWFRGTFSFVLQAPS